MGDDANDNKYKIKLRVKIGSAEFEAEGDEDVVSEFFFKEFVDLVRPPTMLRRIGRLLLEMAPPIAAAVREAMNPRPWVDPVTPDSSDSDASVSSAAA